MYSYIFFFFFVHLQIWKNLVLSICSNDFDQFKEEIEKRIQKREEEREKNRKLMKEEIKREKDLIKKMHNMKNGEGGEKVTIRI